MVIRCPECSTGFELPDKRVTPKGIKVRCSRCSHVFRVRRAEDGESTEIFYRPEDRASESDAADDDRFEESEEPSGFEEDEVGNRTSIGLPPDALTRDGASAQEAEEEELDEEAGNRTQFGMPAATEKADAPAKSASSAKKLKPKGSYNPFPHAGLDLKPKKSSAFSGLSKPEEHAEEASAPEEPLSSDEPEGEDPFGGAFDEPSAPAAAAVAASAVAAPAAQSAAVAEPVAAKPVAAKPVVARPAPKPALADAGQSPGLMEFDPGDDAEDDSLLGRKGSDFGAAEDLVDPSFGMDGPSFDPKTGKIEQAVPAAAPGPRPGAPKPAARAAAAPKPAPVESVAPAKRAPVESWDAEELEPHKIGGSAGQKAIMFLLIFGVIIGGFLTILTVLNDGFLDFKDFPQMLDVAFKGEEYQPREAWLAEATAPVVAPPEDPIEVQAVFVRLIEVGKKGSILVVKGQVRNRDTQDFMGVEMRGLVFNEQGRRLKEATALLGANVSIAEFKNLSNIADAKGLLPDEAVRLSPNAVVPFTLVFDDIPDAVLNDENVAFRVEVARKIGSDDLGAK